MIEGQKTAVTTRQDRATVENQAIDSIDREEEGISFLEAAAKILIQMPKVASALIAFSGLAAVVGWIQARAYYSNFGGVWLVAKLGTVEILTFSWWPLAALVVCLYIGIMNLEDNKGQAKIISNILRYGGIVLVVLLVIPVLLDKFDLPTWSLFLSYILVLAFTLYAGTAFKGLVISVHRQRSDWSKPRLAIIWLFVFFGLYFVPNLLGDASAKWDLSPEMSRLPSVVVRGNEEEDYRLLLSSDNKFYVVRLDQKTDTYPKIFVFDFEDVEYVQRGRSMKAKDASE